MVKFKPVSSKVDFPSLEENILKFWKENKIFEKSIEIRSKDKNWHFLDGPPFVTGMPHYGTLLSSIPKDLFGRYWTMKGYRVRRVWGWDGHGLPIENKVENELGLKSKKDIEEKIGVDKFIKECLKYVNKVSSEWEWYVDHIGRWVDFKHAYKTWDLSYMESVMWVFKQMYNKDLIYKGLRVSLYCPHCATPISNFEVAMDADNYKNVEEQTAVYKYQIKDEKDTYILAWSTTPWNKIVTPALAVNPNLVYIKVKQGDENYILAKPTIKILKEHPFKILEEFKGAKLLGKKFIPHYNFYKIDSDKKAFVIIGGDFVTADEGTGVVTIAAYGEEDLEVMRKENIQIVMHLDEEGMILESVPKFGRMYYLKANDAVIEDLQKRKLVYRVDNFQHPVPRCWRCSTRLYYAPINAWFVDVQKIKPKLFKSNEPINWFPKHFKFGRFAKSMEAAPDWNISRNRYWGSPIPVWECECGERIIPGSIAELETLSGKKITNLHKPDIDQIKILCPKCAKITKRVPEVLDSWIEAGSASFAERHFPFEKGSSAERLEDFFPPDFIVEYTGQIRAWFYVVHVITTVLYDSPGFKNVLVTGVLLGTDGRKMSKNFGNYPDPKEVMQKYGGDAVRIYLLGSPVMKGEDINFSNDGVPEATRGFLLILWNSYKYFVDYALNFNWEPNLEEGDLSVLDKWILTKLTVLTIDLKKAYEEYDTPLLVKLLKEFVVNDLSTWYIRRNRDRISSNEDIKDRNTTLSVLFKILTTYSKLLAPVAPFIAEEIYKNLTGELSVHLMDFPVEDHKFLDETLISDMVLVRKITESAHAKRKEAGIRLRQPLAKIRYKLDKRLTKELEKILEEELNVKNVEYNKSSIKEPELDLDTKITQELKEEGEVRELIRQIQNLRKEKGLTLSKKINIKTSFLPKNNSLKDLILKQTNAEILKKGENLEIEII